MGEVDMPKGEVYHSVEGGNGELGFYLISDGGRTPFRLHFRRPCFIYYQAYPELADNPIHRMLPALQELAARAKNFKSPAKDPAQLRGYAKLFQQSVLQADEGCDFDFMLGEKK